MKEFVFEGFVLLNVRTTACPERFVISANQHRAPCVQRTACRRPNEDDTAFWNRVLSIAWEMAQRSNPNDPLGGSLGGAIECHYDAALTEEAYELLDEHANFLADMRHWARAPNQPWECRAFAINFLLSKTRIEHPATATLQ